MVNSVLAPLDPEIHARMLLIYPRCAVTVIIDALSACAKLKTAPCNLLSHYSTAIYGMLFADPTEILRCTALMHL